MATLYTLTNTDTISHSIIIDGSSYVFNPGQVIGIQVNTVPAVFPAYFTVVTGNTTVQTGNSPNSAGDPPAANTGGGGGASTIVDGGDVTEGSKSDPPATNSTGNWSIESILKGIWALLAAAIPAGSNIIGKVGIDQSTPGTSNAVQDVDGLVPGYSPVTTSSASVIFTQDTLGYKSLVMHIVANGANSSIVFEGSNDNTNWTGMEVLAAASNTFISITGGNGIYVFPCTTRYVRARISTYNTSPVISNIILRSSPVTDPANMTVNGTVAVNGLPSLPAGSNTIGSTLGVTAKVAVVPAVTAATYAANKVIGGILTFASILPASFTGVLDSITLKFKGSLQTVSFNVAIFTSSPTGTFTDTNTAAIAAGDSANLVGIYTLSAANSQLGTHTVYNLNNINSAIKGSTTSLFAVIVPVATTAALASTSDVIVEIGIACG